MTINIETIRKAIGNVEGKSADDVKALILTKGKVPFNQVQKVYKALGFTTIRASYTQEFYDILRDKPMNDKDFEKWVAEGTENRKRHAKHFDAIRQLANDIHAAK